MEHSPQTAIFKQFLALVPFEGWTDQTLLKATTSLAYPESYKELYFREGLDTAFSCLQQLLDQAFKEALAKENLASLRIRERIHKAVMLRLGCYEPYKPVLHRLVPYLVNPLHIKQALSGLWHVADMAWIAAGDQSTDYNYYTKRLLLSAVFTATYAFWLQDDSEKHRETQYFLTNRLEEVLAFGRCTASVKKALTSPDCFSTLPVIRYIKAKRKKD